MNELSRIDTAQSRIVLTPSQLETVKRTVAADCNPDEFELYSQIVRNTGLDPFRKQVVPIIFSKNDADKRKMSIVVTQDGLRTLAARCGDYRPAEDEPSFEIDASLKGPANPQGVVKCTTILWKQDRHTHAWHKVLGWSYWDEYAPVRVSADEFDWVDTGETWPDSGKPKKKKVPKQGAQFAAKLEDGNWTKMPRVMIAKCATMQALRAGWPDTFGGLYSEEEMDRARVDDRTAMEMVEQAQQERRAKTIAMSGDEYPWVDEEGTLKFIPAGRFADNALAVALNCGSREIWEAIKKRNQESLNRFWAMHKDDALQLRKEIDAKVTS